MSDDIKQTIARCVQIAWDSNETDSCDVAYIIAKEMGYDLDDLLGLNKPKEPEWHEELKERMILCWYKSPTIIPSNKNPFGIVAIKKLESFQHNANEPTYLGTDNRVYKIVTPLTDDEIDSFKRVSNEEQKKVWRRDGFIAGQESREELIKKLVADNADLTQKVADLMADTGLYNFTGGVKQ